MATKRFIDPRILEDVVLQEGGGDVVLLFFGLILSADDYGIHAAHPGIVTSNVWKIGQHGVDATRQMLDYLRLNEYILPFEVHGKAFYALRSWFKVQNLSHPRLLTVAVPTAIISRMAEATSDPERVYRAFSAEFQSDIARGKSPRASTPRFTTLPGISNVPEDIREKAIF